MGRGQRARWLPHVASYKVLLHRWQGRAALDLRSNYALPVDGPTRFRVPTRYCQIVGFAEPLVTSARIPRRRQEGGQAG
eukprot:CAMPEP_0204561610 /NCGR_PEP_ID=MMETSP0661-20131031/33283_1 /ASSEMBLY_ACC=CAM_ASM_000606 /TAXON_ID=109239 /ORGANISM="Alexandrium margalefi, Strain AMGDE01CS-322" /LENGTH=78 /DNA_ID=CAMNT_0051569029 /DNA_START=20 /DNA_END=252 /DNA_ORIENTATION=+